MKSQISNITPEGTRNGDVVGGLLLWTGENLQALLFGKGESIGRKRAVCHYGEKNEVVCDRISCIKIRGLLDILLYSLPPNRQQTYTDPQKTQDLH